MIDRYQTLKMKKIWSEEEKIATWLQIEVAYLEHWLLEYQPNELKVINIIKNKIEKVNIKNFIDNMHKYEKITQHDIIAFLYALKDEIKEDARFIHRGLTSSDIVDTSYAILLKKSALQINIRLNKVIDSLRSLALENKGVVCLGRTHGQAAEATTLGLKFLSFFFEFKRHQKRLENAIEEIAIGKFSGAVGVYSFSSPKVESDVLKYLGLKAETLSTQIVARDRHAQFFTTLAIIAGGIERLALEIRLLSHGQVAEISEPFLKDQKGSSAMPHKKNPIFSENLCGLMRLMRGYAQVALENQALWHERDISHSSAERVISADATSVLDFALKRLYYILKNLNINKENINKNFLMNHQKLISQSILEILLQKGLDRFFAYDLIQRAVFNNIDFKDGLIKENILSYMSKEELNNIFNTQTKIKNEDIIFSKIS